MQELKANSMVSFVGYIGGFKIILKKRFDKIHTTGLLLKVILGGSL
ncbi:MAG: hypothetical protein MUO72_17485 [Bacteroidales bacterium]|nr:hypothetical protein [Bacteroidales bacterium]